MMYPVISCLVISPEKVNAARRLICGELGKLHQDYHPEISQDEFIRKYIYPNSLYLIRLQARCFYLDLTEIIISDDLLNFVSEYIPTFNIYHSCFIRFHHPDMTSNGAERLDNIVSSPLHYDNYGEDTRTTWIPLQDIDETTGAFCYSDVEDLIRMTGDGISPEQMHSEGLQKDIQEAYVNSLRRNLKLIKCQAGQAVLFDKSLLHGSTYPISTPRVSVDVRWVAVSKSGSTNFERVKKQLKVIRKNALIGAYVNCDIKFWRRVNYWDFPLVHLKMRLREVPLFIRAIRGLRNIVR